MRYLKEFRETLEKRTRRDGERTFGFEYELISLEELSHAKFRLVREALVHSGFKERDGLVIDGNGMYVTFEPGGQIEFSSPPLRAEELEKFDGLLERIHETVESIGELTGVKYVPEPYIPGRNTSPLLLEAARYRNLHDLLGRTSDRGRDMMKGTAAIHLHAALMDPGELLRVWEFMCALSREDGFRMGPDRSDIWERTDPSRCGLTCTASERIDDSGTLVSRLVEFACRALDLETGIPFGELEPHPDFRTFLEHFTTIFTNVRLNLKGMTLELRTLDSRPLHLFRGTWLTFLDMFQRVMDETAVQRL